MDELAYLSERRINESFALLSIDRIFEMLISLSRSALLVHWEWPQFGAH